jgi:hypothetical protein
MNHPADEPTQSGDFNEILCTDKEHKALSHPCGEIKLNFSRNL